MLIPFGWKEGPAIRYVPVLQSLADHQRTPRQFPLGYVTEAEEPLAASQDHLIASEEASDGPA